MYVKSTPYLFLLVEVDEVEKQFPYSDQEKAAEAEEDNGKKTIMQVT